MFFSTYSILCMLMLLSPGMPPNVANSWMAQGGTLLFLKVMMFQTKVKDIAHILGFWSLDQPVWVFIRGF